MYNPNYFDKYDNETLTNFLLKSNKDIHSEWYRLFCNNFEREKLLYYCAKKFQIFKNLKLELLEYFKTDLFLNSYIELKSIKIEDNGFELILHTQDIETHQYLAEIILFNLDYILLDYNSFRQYIKLDNLSTNKIKISITL